jgi:hypothetical protein
MFYEDDMKPQTDGGSMSDDTATDDSGDKEESSDAM